MDENDAQTAAAPPEQSTKSTALHRAVIYLLDEMRIHKPEAAKTISSHKTELASEIDQLQNDH